MARPRCFDEHQALRSALEVFWAKGYNAASMTDLLDATRLSKSSLYASFGSKQALVVEAMRCYAEQLMDGPLAALGRPDAGRAEIEEALRATVAVARTEAGQRGCFINNCLTEIAPHDAEVMAAAAAAIQRLEAALLAAVRRGQQHGAITTGEAPEALARFLVNTLSGLNLAAKSKPAAERLDDIVRVALRALD
ncbi:TetR/AcrR family transcriptional regulator [Nevskia sp.]|uniref:TetR/AcrR family transcriptional regulator n=1 Tax=Nevskia sp. TaxID=1929292 RepID=UPI003F72BB70